MRRISFIIAALLLSAIMVDATAQQVVKKRIGVYKESGNTVVAEATTTLVVDITVETERFTAGVYARYAQKLLGKRASFVDREQARIVAADVAVLKDAAYYATDISASERDAEEYLKPIPIDRLSTVEVAQEDAAYDAAEQIFALRRARLDLVTGELGEGVYGGGLECALREIDRLEREYLELFYGEHEVVSTTHRVLMPVEIDITSYVIQRFSAERGLVEKSDLNGEIVMVTIAPSAWDYPAGDEKGIVAYHYANNAEVSVMLGQEVLTRRILPIYEFGATVMFANPK
ncbi:MAG: DUF4831 family protein [Alistipes sp.]|nr:DUF4831 family protein [Alistipes sp.]